MPPNATPRENASDRAPKLTRVAGVYSGTRWYDIDASSSLEECYEATGLPAPGSPWSGSLTQLKARIFTPDREPGPSGVFRMQVGYREDSQTAYTADPEFVMTTTIEQSSTSEMVDYDIAGTKSLTNDGRGVPKMLTTLGFEHLRFFETLPDLGPYLELTDEPKVNASDVTLPNFVNSGSPVVVPAGQLLFANFAPSYEQGLFVVRSRLERRRNWLNRRPIVDAKGVQKIGTDGKGLFEEADLYETASYGSILG